MRSHLQRLSLQPHALGCQRARLFAAAVSQDEAQEGSSSWVPDWMKKRLPGFMGGTREIDKMENLTVDDFASQVRNARRLGSLADWGITNANAPMAKGVLRQYEDIIGAMSQEEKADLSQFGPVQRQRVAQQTSYGLHQVDDCIRKYMWSRDMMGGLAKLKREGKPMPKSIEEFQQLM
ncbi:hypothetical protein WJX84_010143, partial [Apatococcus fuscideae]